MKKTYFVGRIVLLFALVLIQTGVVTAQVLEKKAPIFGGQNHVSGEIIVKLKPGVSEKVLSDINSKLGTTVISTSRFGGFKILSIPKRKTVADMMEIYKRNPNVEYAEPNYIAHAFWVPNDPYYMYQWHLDNNDYGGINMESAWEIDQGVPNVIVAVIDTGVAYEDYVDAIPIGRSGKYTYISYKLAPDLADTTFVAGYDFVNRDEHPNDDEGHGTHVTGTIAQSTNNAIGVSGVSANASVMPIKVLDDTGSGTHANIADGIYFAANNGANIINMSLGGSSGSITLENAIAYAYGKGVSIICASGNDGLATTISYPAAYDAYCIAVGATRYDETVAYYSNGGASLDLTAPGGDINVDQNNDGYGDGVLQETHDGSDYTNFSYWFYQGTSMAAPHVSGVAALLIANGVATTPDEVREALQVTAEDKAAPGWDPEYGWGIVDAYAALNYTPIANDPPVAHAGGPYTGTEDIAVNFDGSLSYDPDDGAPLTYKWNFGDGSNGSGVAPSHTYTAGGTYTVTLVVNDGRVDSDPSQVIATITEVNDPPLADAGPEQSALVNEVVTFDGSGSYDIDDGIAEYDWDFGDGATANSIITSHTYSSAGTYTVTLTVTDNGGLTNADVATVTVTEQSTSSMHVADIIMSTKTAGPNVNAIAKVAVKDDSGKQVQGAIVYGSWSGLTSDSDSVATDEDGIALLISDKMKNASGTFIFTVNNITKEGWGYNSASNVETSDSITVP